MTMLKKAPTNQISAYKLAAAARREKIAAMGEPVVAEVKSTQGRIRVKLGGKTVSRNAKAGVFGPSSIEIPEFSLFRKKTTA